MIFSSIMSLFTPEGCLKKLLILPSSRQRALFRIKTPITCICCGVSLMQPMPETLGQPPPLFKVYCVLLNMHYTKHMSCLRIEQGHKPILWRRIKQINFQYKLACPFTCWRIFSVISGTETTQKLQLLKKLLMMNARWYPLLWFLSAVLKCFFSIFVLLLTGLNCNTLKRS